MIHRMIEQFVLVVLLLAACGFEAWLGLFGVYARSTVHRLIRNRRARRQEREMVEVMRRKIVRAEATKVERRS